MTRTTNFRGAWNCVKYLVSERSDEINQCYDENYPIHQCTLHDIKFLGKFLMGSKNLDYDLIFFWSF